MRLAQRLAAQKARKNRGKAGKDNGSSLNEEKARALLDGFPGSPT